MKPVDYWFDFAASTDEKMNIRYVKCELTGNYRREFTNNKETQWFEVKYIPPVKYEPVEPTIINSLFGDETEWQIVPSVEQTTWVSIDQLRCHATVEEKF